MVKFSKIRKNDEFKTFITFDLIKSFEYEFI
jgi:hypothetical protein